MPDLVAQNPEIPITEQWRGVMRRARKAAGLTQEQLADRVGASQALISGIESGSIQQSEHAPAICEALKIPLPHDLARDETDQRWIEVGRVLRAFQPVTYETQLEAFEALAKRIKADKSGE